MRRLLLGLVVAIATLVPNLANGNDQAIARHIMSKLQLEQQRGMLKGFHIDMRVDRGTVWYKGFVSDQQQKDLILRTAQRAKNLGVVQVVDDITVRTARNAAYQQAVPPSMAPPRIPMPTQEMQAAADLPSTANNLPMAANLPTMQEPTVQPSVAQESMAQQAMAQQAMVQQAMAQQAMERQAMARQAMAQQAAMAQQPMPQQAMMQQPMMQQPMPRPMAQQAAYTQYDGNNAQPSTNIPSPPAAPGMQPTLARAPLAANAYQQQPVPMARSASAAMPMAGDNASMPAYAWPSYAAHPNYGAVAYPQQYSPAAWPYIGPFYPYPQVPLGWRKVTLEWDDGWWWLDFHNR